MASPQPNAPPTMPSKPPKPPLIPDVPLPADPMETLKLWLRLRAFQGEAEHSLMRYQAVYTWLKQSETAWMDLPDTAWEPHGEPGKRTRTFLKEAQADQTPKEIVPYLKLTPKGFIPLLGRRSLGEKRLRQLWCGLGVETPEAIREACLRGQVKSLKGFGTKTQAEILDALDFYEKWKGHVRYADGLRLADIYEARLKAHCKGLDMHRTGVLRRCMEVLNELAWVCVGAPKEALVAALEAQGARMRDLEVGLYVLRAREAQTGVGLRFYLSDKARLVTDLFLSTGAAAHLQIAKKGGVSLYQTANAKTYSSEADVYQDMDLPYVPPELREAHWTQENLNAENIDALVSKGDLKGVLHCHSTDSDGQHSLEEMALYAKACGYAYIGITDHSQSAFYAGGLKPPQIKAQHKEVARLNQVLTPFRIFKGIEADILSNGGLDYDDHVLNQFDFVIASVHTGLKMDKEKATNRLLRAIENPYTTILGHMTGRLLLERLGYPVDHARILAACAQCSVAVELNANVFRMDIDWRWIHVAQSLKVPIAITPDAHAKETIKDTDVGILLARKAGLKKTMTLNAYTAAQFTNYLSKKHLKHG